MMSLLQSDFCVNFGYSLISDRADWPKQDQRGQYERSEPDGRHREIPPRSLSQPQRILQQRVKTL